MILGEQECDSQMGYFLQHGCYPKVQQQCKCKYGLTDDDIDYHIHKQNFDEYYCWQGTRIPKWFE